MTGGGRDRDDEIRDQPIHGSAFAMHANSVTRAFLWDENRAGVTTKPKGIRNIDGQPRRPIIRRKLFFFADWKVL